MAMGLWWFVHVVFTTETRLNSVAEASSKMVTLKIKANVRK
jgi:hypothetical protein